MVYILISLNFLLLFFSSLLLFSSLPAGYVLDYPYRENSAPWFGFSKVAKGGAWSTTLHLSHATYRNFYDPGGRREVPIGFRVVAKK